MAFIQMSVMSQSLMRTVPVNVILPADKMTVPGMPARTLKPFKTLYLLHGVFGSDFDWVTSTKVRRFAEAGDLAVVMPSGENMFYVDQKASHNYYGEFIGRELVELTRRMFRLSERREDTFIAGLSMGGYGALRNGLKYHETFGCIAALSTALVTDDIEKRTDAGGFLNSRSYAESVFGDLDKVAGSDKDPRWLAGHVAELAAVGKAHKPRIYLACGLSDGLLPKSREMRDLMETLGYEVTYEEAPGSHEWDFWGSQIEKVIRWLPLEEAREGVGSGNVGI